MTTAHDLERGVLAAARRLEETARLSHRNALVRRRRAIRLARERGMTLDAIAAELQITRAAVIAQLKLLEG